MIQSINGNKLQVEGISSLVLNLSSFDFLGMSQSADIKEKSAEALDKYGVGSCGPRGFYGTVDKHLQFESAIAKFMGTEVIFSYRYFCLITYLLLKL